jgi:hypothetical protein
LTNDPGIACERALAAGERLLWCGRPTRPVRLRPLDALLIPFSLLWAGFTVFWEASVLQKGSHFMEIWGIPFVAIGIYLVIGRFVMDARAWRSTVYGVTSDRVLVIGGFFRVTVYSHPLPLVSAAQLAEHADGTATVTLLPQMIPSVWQGKQAGWGLWQSWSPYVLANVANGKQVYDLILSRARQTTRV